MTITADWIDPAELTPEERLRNYRPFARKIANYTARRHCVDADEAYADALIGLWRAAERWDPTRGIKFGTYASRRIRGQILDGIRQRGQISRSACRNRTGVDIVSLDEPIHPDSTQTLGDRLTVPSGEDAVILSVDMTAVVRDELDRLSVRDRRMVTDRIAGRTLAEIAADFGVSECRVSQIFTQWRAQMDSRLPVNLREHAKHCAHRTGKAR